MEKKRRSNQSFSLLFLLFIHRLIQPAIKLKALSWIKVYMSVLKEINEVNNENEQKKHSNFFFILLVLVLAFFLLIASNMISIPFLNEDRTVSHFLYISNISAGEEKSFLGDNDTKDEIINMGFEIKRINDTYIKERPALGRAFENQGFTDIYHEDRDSIFPLKGTVLEYNDSLYLVSIGSY